MKMTKAFTIIELVFVIVVLGILSAVALPKFQGVRNQADIVNAKAQLSTIRAAIANDRQRRLILGCSDYAGIGDATSTCANGTVHDDINRDTTGGTGLFGGVLTTPITNADDVNVVGKWYSADRTLGVFSYKVGDDDATTFTYEDTNGTIRCTQTGTNHCDDIDN